MFDATIGSRVYCKSPPPPLSVGPADADDRGATDVIKAAENKDRNKVWVECKVTRGFHLGGCQFPAFIQVLFV